LVEDERTIDINPDQDQLTTWYTEHAVDFIERNKERPFFLYVPHAMVHVPLFVSEKFRGKSERGLFGDVMMEVDWSVGQILDALRRNGIDKQTLVVYTSDNGPWLSYGDHAGSAGHFREGKGTSFEGGQRVPGVAWWPGQIPAGSVCDEPAMTIDLLPTIAGLIGGTPKNKIDGLDIWPLLSGVPNAKSPHDALYFYRGPGLGAVRSGKWKLCFPQNYNSLDGTPGGTGGFPVPYRTRSTGLALYNLEEDLAESVDVAAANPEVVERLERLAERARAALGDALTNRTGAEVRPAGRV
jgi:arylsulfatase A